MARGPENQERGRNPSVGGTRVVKTPLSTGLGLGAATCTSGTRSLETGTQNHRHYHFRKPDVAPPLLLAPWPGWIMPKPCFFVSVAPQKLDS